MSIVTVNVYIQAASAPSTLQRTGALISIGGTSTAPNTKTLLTKASDLTAVLAGAVPITSATESGTTVTIITTAPHGYTTGDSLTITGFTTPGYNGTFTITVTGSSTFTYTASSGLTTPAVGTGVATDQDVAELTAMVNTFFAQGSGVSVYVLELGHGTVVAQIAALAAYLTANPGVFYSFLVPREFDGQATYITLVNQFTTPTSKLYFWTTTTSGTYTDYTHKSVVMGIEETGIPVTEFSLAAQYWVSLSYNPSVVNRITQMAYSFIFGVTPLTAAHAATYAATNVNYVATAAEGGLSNLMVGGGNMADGNQFNYWYSVDSMQVAIGQAVAAAVINGSNNQLAPLYYNQPGINQLQTVAQNTAFNQISGGLAVGPVSVYQYTAAQWAAFLAGPNVPLGVLINADPFLSFTTEYPSDYAIGLYGGLSIAYTPQLGFKTIVFNIFVSAFATA